MPKKYDFLIVGAGLFGATVGYFLHRYGKKVLIIDKNLWLIKLIKDKKFISK